MNVVRVLIVMLFILAVVGTKPVCSSEPVGVNGGSPDENPPVGAVPACPPDNSSAGSPEENPPEKPVGAKPVCSPEQVGLKPGTVIPDDVLNTIAQFERNIGISQLQQKVINADIEKNRTAWLAEFYIWLATQGVKRDDMGKWTITNRKAVLKK